MPGGDRFFIEKPRRGGSPVQEGPRGREGVCGELGNLGGGGANIFFGAEMSAKFQSPRKNGPKSQLKCPKSPFLGVLIPQKWTFWTF